MWIFDKIFCKHNWEEKYMTDVYETPTSARPCKTKVTLICSKCGKIKQIEI